MESTSELSKFKEHVQLYEFLMERAEKRVMDGVMPRIKSLQSNVAQINNLIVPANSGSIMKSENASSDAVFFVGMGFLVLAFIYCWFKYGKQLRLY